MDFPGPALASAGHHDRIEKPLASPHTNRESAAPAAARGSRTVTAAEKAQAREVSLRRIGRLFTPYRWPLAIVTAIIVASSIVGLASPFLLRAVIDTALPARNVQLLAWLVVGMVAVAAVTSAFGRDPDLDQHQGRPAGHARAAHQRLRPPAAAVDRLLHPHPHRRGPVPHHQRHRRHGIGRDLDRDLDRLQPHHRGRHRGRHGRPVLAAVAHLAGRHAAGDLPDPQGRPHAPRHHHRSSSASWPTSTSPSRRACRSTASSWPRRWAPARRWSSGSPPPRPG